MKSAYHPKSFLTLKRNVHRGLINRTKIVSLLERDSLSAKALAERTRMKYNAVLHHLHLLEAEYIITRRGGRPYIWELTGVGQQTLMKNIKARG